MPNVHADAAHHRLRRLRRRHLRRGGAGAATIVAAPSPHASRASAVAHRRASARSWRPVRASGPSSSATTTGPASCWPRPCATYANRYGVAAGQARRRLHQQRLRPTARRATCKARASSRGRSSTAARRTSAGRTPPACRCCAAARSSPMSRAARRVEGRRRRSARSRRTSPAMRWPCPAAGARSSTSPASRRQAAVGRAICGLRARPTWRRPSSAAGSAAGRMLLVRVPRRWRRQGADARRAGLADGSEVPTTRPMPITPAVVGARSRRARPSSTSRTT